MSSDFRYRTGMLACVLAGILLTPATPLAWIVFALVFREENEEKGGGLNIVLKMCLLALSAAIAMGTSDFISSIMRRFSLTYFTREPAAAPYVPAHLFMLTVIVLYPQIPNRLSDKIRRLCSVKSYYGLSYGKLIALTSSILIVSACVIAPFKTANAKISLDTFFLAFGISILSASMILGISTFYIEKYRKRR